MSMYAGYAERGLMKGFPPAPDLRVNARNGIVEAPYNRWSYQNMRKLLPSADVRSTGPASELGRELSPELTDVTVPRTDGSRATLADFLQETYTDSIIVVSGGQLVFEEYFNSMTAHTPHMMMSCGKSFVGLAAILAAARGELSEGERVGDAVPEVDNGGAFADCSVGHLLDMTNSMSFDEDYANPASDIREYARVVGLERDPDRPSTAADLYGYLPTLGTDPAHGHGEVFHYQTPKVDMLNWVLNRRTGRDLVQEMTSLWSAIGAAGEAYLLLDPSVIPIAGGGFNATAQDLARFARMLVENGRVGDTAVVPAGVLDTLAAGGSPTAFLAGPEAVGYMAGGDWTYRAFWWIRHTPGREAITAIGIHGQWIYCDLNRGIAIVKQSSHPESYNPEVDGYIVRAFDAIIDTLT